MSGIDLTGNRYGRLVVISEAERVGENRRWVCKCDCGNEVTVYGSSLKRGRTKSCGCLRKERTTKADERDLSGRRFGKLLVIEKLSKNEYGRIIWKCMCDCGSETEVAYYNLVSEKTTSCGCVRVGHLNEALETQRVDGVVVPKLKQKVRVDSSTGHKGVSKTKNGKYVARLMVKGKDKYLGTHETLELAIKARKRGEELYYKPYIEALEGNND